MTPIPAARYAVFALTTLALGGCYYTSPYGYAPYYAPAPATLTQREIPVTPAAPATTAPKPRLRRRSRRRWSIRRPSTSRRPIRHRIPIRIRTMPRVLPGLVRLGRTGDLGRLLGRMGRRLAWTRRVRASSVGRRPLGWRLGRASALTGARRHRAGEHHEEHDCPKPVRRPARPGGRAGYYTGTEHRLHEFAGRAVRRARPTIRSSRRFRRAPRWTCSAA